MMKRRLFELLDKKSNDTISVDEQSELDRLAEDIVIAGECDSGSSWKSVEYKYNMRKNLRIRKLFLRVAAVTIPFIAVMAIIYSISFKEVNIDSNTVSEQQTQKPIVPIGRVAYLTRESGETIDLSKGVAEVDNVEIHEKDGVRFKAASIEKGRAIEIVTLTIPRGGEYNALLSDGTKVWLNASSRLRFPEVFVAGEVREVWLEGEALFDVAKVENSKFIVHTSKMDIDVKGTLFNVMAYKDEPIFETTLIRGSVEVAKGENRVLIEPSTQASTDGVNGITTKIVDTQRYIKAAQGILFFDNEKFSDIARRLERWYDVKIEYANNKVRDIHFYGSISKYETIQEVLEMLSLTRTIKYTIDEKVVTIN